MSRPIFEEFKKEALSNPEVKKEYDRLAPIFEIKKELLSARLRKRAYSRRSGKENENLKIKYIKA